MATNDEDASPLATDTGRYGDDTPPLFASVRDQPYSRGCMTSQARTMCPQYIEFLKRHTKEVRDGRE